MASALKHIFERRGTITSMKHALSSSREIDGNITDLPAQENDSRQYWKVTIDSHSLK
jgi:hypothetical protein